MINSASGKAAIHSREIEAPTSCGGRTYVAGTNDRAIPVSHVYVFTVCEAVGTRSITDALLTLLELVEQTEIAGDCRKECR